MRLLHPTYSQLDVGCKQALKYAGHIADEVIVCALQLSHKRAYVSYIKRYFDGFEGLRHRVGNHDPNSRVGLLFD